MADKFLELKENLEKLEKWGIRVIKDRYKNLEKEKLGGGLKGQIINVFNNLFEFEPEYNKMNFDTKILKKKFSSTPSKEKIVKLIYTFLCDNKVKEKKQIEKMYKNIENQIKKFNNNPGLPFPKEYLIKKLKRLKRAKIQSLSCQTTTDGFLDLTLIENFESQREIDKKTINNIITALENADPTSSIVESNLVKFCKILSDKCKNIQEVKEEDRQDLHNFMKDAILRIEIISAQMEWKDAISDKNNTQRYLKDLKNFVQRMRSSKKQFSKIEQKRVKRAYSIESMERIIQVHNHIIDRANEVLKANGIEEINPQNLNEIKKYEEMANSKDPKLLEKSYFDRAVKKIQSIVESEISKSKRKSMFKTKAPSSDQVLKEILKLF